LEVTFECDAVMYEARKIDGKAFAVLINARKQQRLFPEHVRFLARGVHELHCIDESHRSSDFR
jgi:hypothetical protein